MTHLLPTNNLPAPGSSRAYDALLNAYVVWHGADGHFDYTYTGPAAKAAADAWMTLLAHAVNCGMALREPCTLTWIKRRIVRWSIETGHEVEGIALVGEAVQ